MPKIRSPEGAGFLIDSTPTFFSFHPAQPRSLSDFRGLSEPDQARWHECGVAQKLWRDAAIQGVESPEVQFFWQSSEHEIDFRKSPGQWIEVKRGKSEPMEFRWFSKVFPKAHLKVICSTPFATPLIQGVSLEELFLEEFLSTHCS